MFTDIEDVVEGLSQHFEKFNIDFFIVGAKARDILAKKAGIKISPRKTSDVDFAVLVESWQTLEDLRDSFKLDENIHLSSSKENLTRYYYKKIPFDIVPFGEGVEKEGKIYWPPFYKTILTVVGYKEAMSSAKVFELNGRNIKVTSAEMLVALKLVSWDENNTRDRDAKDIHYILTNYNEIDPDVEDDVFENFDTLIDQYSGDTKLASISILGYRVSKFANENHKKLILSVLENDEKITKLSRSMVNTNIANFDDEIDNSLSILNALLFGINLK
jgi:predicted nucleotidyltransferase